MPFATQAQMADGQEELVVKKVARRLMIEDYFCQWMMMMAISALRRRLGVLTVKCQTYSLLGRLETLGPGATAAAGRRWQAAELERCWRREERAHSLATTQAWRSYWTGFGKLD